MAIQSRMMLMKVSKIILSITTESNRGDIKEVIE